MGIPNFLVHILKSGGRLVDLRDYADKEPPLRIAIDVSTWIYKACQAYSDMLADEKHLSNYGRAALLFEQEQRQQQQQQQEITTNDATTANIDVSTTPTSRKHDTTSKATTELLELFVAKCCTTVIDRLEGLRTATNAELLVVLDGGTPPVKTRTVEKRKRQREMEEDLRDRPVDVTADTPTLERRIKANRRTGAGPHYTAVVEAVLAALRHRNTSNCPAIPFLVAPYEADGQLAFLQSQGFVDLVITEDSDLIAYGVTKPVLYKLSVNPDGALTRGILVRRQDLAARVPVRDSKFDVLDFTPAMWACLFAASGCDYCGKLRGIGVAGACRDVRWAFFPRKLDPRSPLERLLDKLLQSTWDRGKLANDAIVNFKRDFLAALLMFRHNIVYDPVMSCCRSMLRPEEIDPELVSYEPYAELVRDETRRAEIVGKVIPSPIATHVAEGWIRPKSMQLRKNVEIPEQVQKDLDQYLAETPRGEDEVYCDDELETQEEVFTPRSIPVAQARMLLELEQPTTRLRRTPTPDRVTGGGKRAGYADDNVPVKKAVGELHNTVDLADDSSLDEEGELLTQGQQFSTTA